MKPLLRVFSITIFLFLIAFMCFFVWASSSTLDVKEYKKLITKSSTINVGNDSVYSIMTYNIGYLSGMTNNLPVAKPKELFDRNLEKVLLETKRLQPDIIAFQEIDYNSARSYSINQQNEIAKLGYNYIAEAVNWDKTYVPFPYWPPSLHFGKILSGQSILSKYKINEYHRIVLKRVANAPFYRDAIYLDRIAQVSKINLNGKEVVVINVHLEAFDKPTRVKQFNQVVAILKKYSSKYPTILLGDFNSKARDKEAIIHTLFSMDAFGNAAFSVDNPVNTFDTKNPKERIDYIFYTKNTIEYIDGKVLTQFGQASDHLPVQMSFKLI